MKISPFSIFLLLSGAGIATTNARGAQTNEQLSQKQSNIVVDYIDPSGEIDGVEVMECDTPECEAGELIGLARRLVEI